MNNIEVLVHNSCCGELLSALSIYTTKILKPNISQGTNTLSLLDFDSKNVKYIIKWNYDLLGGTITIPKNCILEFDGGSISNGTIIGQDTLIINVGNVDIWKEDLEREGTWRKNESGGSIEQIQSDWNQSDNTKPDYINNKPEIPSVEGLASKQFVEDYTYDKETINRKVAGGGTFDPTNYYDKHDIDASLQAQDQVIALKAPQETTYTKEEVDNLIEGAGGNPDKPYDLETHSGLGRKTLQLKSDGSNILTQEDFDEDNTIYVIQYDFDLNGETIEIPERCILDFEGGSFINGSLEGAVKIINKPNDLYELVNCMELYVINETHLSVADISEVFDRYYKDEVVTQDAIKNRYSLAHFYCIAGMDKIIFRIPSHAFDNAQGTTYHYLPYMRYLFYDRDFKYIDVRPEWTARDEMYIFDNIPEGAAYINVIFSDDDHLNKPMILQDVLKYMYFNFLDNTKVYINLELKNDADVIDFTAYQRTSNTTISYYSYVDPSATDKYIKGAWSIGNLTRSSYFIPRSILKNYDYIELVGHGTGSRYTFVDEGIEEERAYNPMVISFLKKTPIYNYEDVEYSDTYPWRMSYPQAQKITLAIPDDCKCIFISKVEFDMGSMLDCSPAQILLKKKSACDIGGFDTTDLSKISNRDVNTQEIKFVHWNIGADNIGGLMPRQEQVTSELLTKRRDSFNAFFGKINRTHNILFNEFNYWFDSAHSIDYMSLSASSLWQGKKRFDMRQYQNLGIFYKNDLLEYKYGTFECLKGFTEMGTSSVRGGRYYSYGYTIYHYPVAGANLYVMSTHLPTPLSADSLKKIYREMKSIMEQYPNAVIVGDMNDSGNFNPYTHTGNNFANIEEVFTEESGWHIANKELDDTPTYDLGKDYWNPTQPAAGRLDIILDFCVWKGNYITMSDFRVRKDAIIVGSEALEATEGVFINDNGDVEGNEDYINHRLSDHWPIEFTIKPASPYSIVPDTEGSTRYNPDNKKFEWHNGERWVISESSNLGGKTINFLGDSYIANNGRPFSETWAYLLGKKHNMIVNNYGINGNPIVATTGTGTPMVTRYADMADDVDYVIVVGGKNDYNQQLPIADFRTGLKMLIAGLIEKYTPWNELRPSYCKIAFFTPWKIYINDADDPQPIKLEEYVRAIIEVCNEYSIPVFDSAHKSGVVMDNATFRTRYCQSATDRSHFNSGGHIFFLPKAESFIESI